MKVKVRMPNGKTSTFRVKADNQLDAAACVAAANRFYGLMPVFIFKGNN